MSKGKVVKEVLKAGANAIKKASNKAGTKTPVKKAAKKAVKKVARNPVKKVASNPVKKVASNPVKKVARKQTARSVANRPIQGPQTAAESVAGRPMQGPANYSGRYWKDKAKAEEALKKAQEKFMNSAGVGPMDAKRAGASEARKKVKESISKINKSRKRVGRTIKSVKKRAKAVAKHQLTTAGVSGYVGAKLAGGGKNNNATQETSNAPARQKTNGSYFTQAELEAARKRLEARKK